MSSAASLLKKDIQVLHHTWCILKSQGLPTNVVFQFRGDQSISQDQQVQGCLTAEGVEVHNMGVFREELVAETKAEAEELEEVHLDNKKEAY